ncbi:hypothetical protein EV424DRAFT_1554085 [Suillus variegatus]|nr:hypothetical protein EV424DRAFT_1554085 [Suillus variegatus]
MTTPWLVLTVLLLTSLFVVFVGLAAKKLYLSILYGWSFDRWSKATAFVTSEIDRTCPGTLHTFYVSLTTQYTLRTDFKRDTSDFGCILQIKDFATSIDINLFR